MTGFGVNGGCGVLGVTGGLPGTVAGMGFAARLQVRGSIRGSTDRGLWFEMPVEELGSHLKQRLRRVVHRIAETVTGARDLIES